MRQGEAEASSPHKGGVLCDAQQWLSQPKPLATWHTLALVCWTGNRALVSLRLRTATVTAAPIARPTRNPMSSSAKMEPETVALPSKVSSPEQWCFCGEEGTPSIVSKPTFRTSHTQAETLCSSELP